MAEAVGVVDITAAEVVAVIPAEAVVGTPGVAEVVVTRAVAAATPVAVIAKSS
jgi:hypothetical protein